MCMLYEKGQIKMKDEIRLEKKKLGEERRIVVPGELIVSGYEFLPGEGCIREEKDIISIKYGIVNIEKNLVKVTPLGGVYLPRTGNIIIGQVKDVVFNGWIVDIFAPHLAFLSVSEFNKFIKKDELSSYLDINDIIITKVKAVQPRSVVLSMKEKGLCKIKSGLIVKVGSTRVARIIGRGGSMINTIKKTTDTRIVVGQNGVIWIKGNDAEMELVAKETIELIARNPLLDGLTEKVKEFLEKKIKLKKSSSKNK